MMFNRFIPTLTDLYKNALAKLTIVMLAIALVGFSTVSHYGVSWDEPYGTNSVWWNIHKITRNEPIPGIFEYDGTVFNVAAEAVFQVQKRVEKVFSTTPAIEAPQTLEADQTRKRFQSKHAFTFATTLFAYLLTAIVVGIFCGIQFAWLGAVILALMPEFWGHGFFNFKDSPFATLFMLNTLLGAYLVEQCLRPDSRLKLGLNRLVVTSILYGILIGLLAGVRAGGLVVIVFPLITCLLVQFSNDREKLTNHLFKIGGSFALAVGACLVTATLCYPSSWSNPIVWFYRALQVLSQYQWDGKVLFNGEFFAPQSLPWYYIPTWVGISVPLLIQCAFIVGLVFILRRYSKFSRFQQACAVLLLLQIFLLPTLAVLRKSVIYGGIRHFLFIMPAIAAISAIALVWIYHALPQRNLKRFAIGLTATLLLGIGLDMAALHPYEYVYFNRISGGLAKANQRFETDYWALSLREGIEWISQQPDHTPVLVGGPLEPTTVFADPHRTLVSFSDRTLPQSLSKPYYYLSMYGGNRQFQSYFQDCATVHQVTRQDVPLAIVRRCDP